MDNERSMKSPPGGPEPPDAALGGLDRRAQRRERELEPRLPHEHDESADSQAAGQPSERMRKAQADIEAGVVDTDRGVPMEELYDRELRSPGPEKAAEAPRQGRREGGERQEPSSPVGR